MLSVSQPKRHPAPATICRGMREHGILSHSLNGIPPLQRNQFMLDFNTLRSHSLNGIPPLQRC